MIKIVDQNSFDYFLNKYYSEENRLTLGHSNIYYLEEDEDIHSYVIVSEGYQIVDYHYESLDVMEKIISGLKDKYDELVVDGFDINTLLKLGFKEDMGEYVWLKD